METIFMNRENSKTSEPQRYKLDLTDKRNLKNPNKNMALANLSITLIMLGKTSSQKTTTINLKFLLQLGMILLICLMVLILLQIFKIILNLSSKNMKLWLKIYQFKFTQIKSKTELFQNKNQLQIKMHW